jgi:NADPH:quinone reductase
MRAIRVETHGGPEVLKPVEIDTPRPGRGEALVRVEACGVNFIDVYHRTGLYPLATPFTPGLEGAGTVEAVGPEVAEVRPGERVAWAGLPGSYAERLLAPAARLVPVPQGIDTKQAAALMLQGMTAHYLAVSTYSLRQGDTCLVHAAAGGVGLLLCQIAKQRGARVIGTVSSERKAALAKEAGADAIIFYTRQDTAVEARRLTDGRGVQVVYDSVGQATFEKSLDALAPRGMLVSFGQSSGPVPPFDAQILSRKGSLYLTRPTLFTYVATREELLQRAGEVLGWVAGGSLRLRIDRELPLADAAAAHRALEGRQTSGKVLLIP